MDKIFRDSSMVINFTNDKVPQFIEPKKTAKIPFVKYGENNDYPNFLLTLFNRSAKHNAICTSKQSYVKGQGFVFDTMGMEGEQIAILQSYIDAPNEYLVAFIFMELTIRKMRLLKSIIKTIPK